MGLWNELTINMHLITLWLEWRVFGFILAFFHMKDGVNFLK